MNAKGLKVLLRSRSLDFTRDYLRYQAGANGNDAIGGVAWWNGDRQPVYYRKGTSDVGLVYDILFKPGRKSEYWLPEGLEASQVLDIGGNVGIAARYLGWRFPQAVLHSFEPIPENFALLRRNAAGSRLRAYPFGLGSRSGRVAFSIPASGKTANRGGWSRFAQGDARPVEAEVRAVGEALAELGIAQADVIKIDVEGAEHDILGAFPDDFIARTTWIYGELHSDSIAASHAFRVLARLAERFDIEVYKPLRKRNWFFDACNRSASERFRGFRRGH